MGDQKIEEKPADVGNDDQESDVEIEGVCTHYLCS